VVSTVYIAVTAKLQLICCPLLTHTCISENKLFKRLIIKVDAQNISLLLLNSSIKKVGFITHVAVMTTTHQSSTHE
jgi:hypothetical protein